MWSDVSSPVPVTENRPMKRHGTARYYAHRVKESLTTRVSKLICGSILFVLFVLGLIAFIVWLSLRPHRPRIYIHEFTVPSLGNGFVNSNIIFNITIRNPNHKVGFYYDALQATARYEQQQQNISNMILSDPFYQAPKNTRIFAGTLSGTALKVSGEPWKQILVDLAQGPASFTLELSSNIRFKIFAWISRRHKLHATCAAGVGSDGFILPNYKDKRCSVYFT